MMLKATAHLGTPPPGYTISQRIPMVVLSRALPRSLLFSRAWLCLRGLPALKWEPVQKLHSSQSCLGGLESSCPALRGRPKREKGARASAIHSACELRNGGDVAHPLHLSPARCSAPSVFGPGFKGNHEENRRGGPVLISPST